MDGMTEFSDVKEALSLPVDDDAYETLNGLSYRFRIRFRRRG